MVAEASRGLETYSGPCRDDAMPIGGVLARVFVSLVVSILCSGMLGLLNALAIKPPTKEVGWPQVV